MKLFNLDTQCSSRGHAKCLNATQAKKKSVAFKKDAPHAVVARMHEQDPGG